jgi:ABC-2 type transport system ATP-binding protein
VIEARRIFRSYDDRPALDDVTLHVDAGEVMGLIGLNGAGKTTLLRILGGVMRPDAGDAFIAGVSILRDGLDARRRLALVPDTPYLFEALTVREHLEFLAAVYEVADSRARVRATLAELELADLADHVVSTLSRGMRQQVSLGCAFVHRPAALLMDEPFLGLDPPSRLRLEAFIGARAREGSAVLVSSHELHVLERLCRRFVLIHRGRVRLAGTLDEIRRTLGTVASLEEAFIGATQAVEAAS